MWMFLLLYSVYFTVLISANELCPDGCECQAKIIKCMGRKLLQIPNAIPKDVTNLDLSGNRLSLFENNTFLEFSNLIELNLNDNEIKDVASLGEFPKSLRILHLKGNKLKSLGGNWMQFTKLDFSQNRIEAIGNETFMGVRNLTELILSNNQIRSIPPTALKDLPSLRRLKLDGNNLTELPEIKCPSLKTLDLKVLKLSNNKIKVLKVATFSNLKVKRLYLNGNLLESVTRQWMFGMRTLEYLRLDNNKIANISTTSWKANCCEKLKYINLAHNNLKRILFDSNKNYDANFMNLDKLETLNLGSNKIFDISDGAFKDLKKLRILDLSNNRISLVENSTFKKLPSLEMLDMRNNPIVEVTKDAFTSLEKLRDLRMNSDVLYCSCKLRWFSQWLRTKRFSRSIGFKCNQPKKLSGIDFTKIPLKDLVCDSSRPEIIGHPESQIAMTGDEVRLSCTVKNGSIEGLRILWQKNMNNIDMTESNVMILTQKQDKFEIYKSTLSLRHVTDAKDGGTYQCFVLAGKERIPSRIARLRVFVYPKFTRTPGDLVTNIGDDVRFNCSASGHPVPQISFRKVNDPRQQAVEERRIGLDGTTFIIRNVSRTDVGLYRCVAKSEAGVINTTFTLNVIGKPVSVHKMFDKVTLVNDAAMFVCAASGWPRPRFTWFKDGKILDLTSSNLQLRNERDAQHLVILHVGYSDAGRYKCRVSNVLGSVALSSQLKVVKDLSEKPDSPDDDSVSHKTLIGAVVFTAACTMVVTTLICVAVLHVITHRGCACLTQHKTSETVTLDSYATTNPENQEYVQMADTFPNESPRSSSTFVTSSDSQTHSDLQTSSSESGSSKEHREGSYDGRHSSGVCSMNSSNSSLASTTNHRNTFPFSNTKTYLYPGTGEELYDVTNASNEVSSTRGLPTPRESLQLQINEQYYPGRRKHRSSRDKPSRSRERHVNKRRKGTEQERLHINEPPEQTSATDEYRTESVTESEGTVL
ncbi:leucine-rich repeats and immunoglobulin-like domains 1 [Paramuricea clavata]|uniref:Leucine-rich repeats and immunoglobulin-like domains 1 n=1 Tax=Paramuricea clavata TaxID=317549 RepID=A0A6S7FU39_PARCT|nr:leucine-rich repeats and immunoglobulin-like domains 1 [Paramuricea clavata]